ncbi:MAG: GldG family protein [Oscillospiraceae bacterium]
MSELEKNIKEQTEDTEEALPTPEPSQPEKNKKEKKKMSAGTQKKLRYGALATAITCVVTAIVVVVNVLVSGLMEKYPLKLDLTEDGIYEISNESINYLQGLQQDVNFTVLMSESSFQTSGLSMKMVGELLEKYAQYSDKVHLTFVDPSTNPDIVNTYQENYSGSLTEGDIIISDANDNSKMRVVNAGNLFSYDQEKLYYYRYYGQGSLEDSITGFTGEQNLTAALMYVTDADPVKVAVLSKANGTPVYNQTYNYYSIGMMGQTLTKNGYDVQEVDIYTDELSPETYDLVILPAPINDLTSTAIDKLSAFLYNDGEYNRNMLYIADFTQGNTPNLDELLSTWGISVTKNLALEGDDSAAQQVTLALGNAAVPLATIEDESYATGLDNAALPIAAPLCRPIEFLWESQGGGITSALLKTSETVYLNEMGEKTNNNKKESAGAQTVMGVSVRKEYIDNIPHQSSVMVMGSMMLADYYLMQDASYNNAQYFISAVNQMAGKDSGLIIAEKQLTAQTLNMTTGDMRGSIFVVFAVPAAVMAIGVFVIMRRRNK